VGRSAKAEWGRRQREATAGGRSERAAAAPGMPNKSAKAGGEDGTGLAWRPRWRNEPKGVLAANWGKGRMLYIEAISRVILDIALATRLQRHDCAVNATSSALPFLTWGMSLPSIASTGRQVRPNVDADATSLVRVSCRKHRRRDATPARHGCRRPLKRSLGRQR
jgi:hypothetical protein